MSEAFNKSVETCREIVRWRVNPYKCLYHNPKKYAIVEFARWTQKYLNYRVYKALLDASAITGYEPVPAELLNRHASRSGYSGRSVRVGKLMFYLIKPEEMGKSFSDRYFKFKEIILNDIGEVN